MPAFWIGNTCFPDRQYLVMQVQSWVPCTSLRMAHQMTTPLGTCPTCQCLSATPSMEALPCCPWKAPTTLHRCISHHLFSAALAILHVFSAAPPNMAAIFVLVRPSGTYVYVCVRSLCNKDIYVIAGSACLGLYHSRYADNTCIISTSAQEHTKYTSHRAVCLLQIHMGLSA